MESKTQLVVVLFLVASLAGACASTSSHSASSVSPDRAHRLKTLDKALARAEVRDASLRVADSHVWARADVRSVAPLERALAAADRTAKIDEASRFLRDAAEDGHRAFELELARLPEPEARRLARDLGCPAGSPRDCLLRTYRRDARADLDAHLAELRALPTASAVDAWVSDLRADLRPSIKTRGRVKRRALTAPLFPFVYAWRKVQTAHEYEGPQPLDYPHVRVYRPTTGPEWAGAEPEHRELLARWAPILVQEVDPDPVYPARDDRIGRMYLEAGPRGPVGAVDVDAPTSYAYVDELTSRGRRLTQLVYTFWYPEHPKLSKGVDFEHGRIEGITLRVTLDGEGRPSLYETVYNCGCYHRVFVDRKLEERARADFGPPEETRPYAVQRHVEGKIDWIVPELVDVDPDGRPLFFVRAGFHLPASVRFTPPASLDLAAAPSETYALASYRELETLPFDGRPVGLFDDTGLVRGARRLEGTMLTPLGIYQAGHPRQRGTQLIHFDQADFDDPTLYDTYLRLPEDFWDGDGGETPERLSVAEGRRK